jgi:5-hydroxyisourate hydrolase
MISTHVLDTARGLPASGVPVMLELRHESGWAPVARGSTDHNGRLMNLTEENRPLQPGTYRLTFDTASYQRAHGIGRPFFPEVEVVFNVESADEHFHLPLLVSPYGYSTYRGS